MADGFTLDIDADLADLIERRAKEVGAPPELVARQALSQALFRYEDYEWINGDPRGDAGRVHIDESDCGSLEDVEAKVRAKLDRMLGPV